MKNKFVFLMAMLSLLLIIGTSQVYADMVLSNGDNYTNPYNSSNSSSGFELAMIQDLANDNSLVQVSENDDWQYAILKFGNLGRPEDLLGEYSDYFLKNEWDTIGIQDGLTGIDNEIDWNDLFINYGETNTFYLANLNLSGDDTKLSHVIYYGNTPVPEPATMLLLGSGLVGLASFGRRKFKK